MRTMNVAARLCTIIALGCAFGGGHAFAKEARGGSVKDDARIQKIEEQLRSKDRSEVLEGFQAMEKMREDAAPAVPTANRVLLRGLPFEISISAIRALGRVGHPSSSRPISAYLHHRRVELRREAARALGSTGGQEAKRGLLRALSDGDGIVRGYAATGLGEVGAGEHVDALFVALDQGVMEAAGSIGLLCEPEQCEQFASRTGKIGFDVMISGFEQILFRDRKQMPDDQKIRIIGRVREVGTRQAHLFLKDVQSRWPRDSSARVKKALELAVLATEASPGEES